MKKILPEIACFYDECFKDPHQWLIDCNHRALIYFRGLKDLILLDKLIDEALSRDHVVILTGLQISRWRLGCGYHLTRTDRVEQALSCVSKLNSIWPLTANCSSLDEWISKKTWPADAWFVSPVLRTSTHPEFNPLGWDAFSLMAKTIRSPVFALGGMRSFDLDLCKAYGGYGIAGVSNIRK